jgi:hypothetical protein
MTESQELYELANCEIERLEVDDEHYYYGGAKGEEKQFYLGVTTVLDMAAPFPEGLRQYLRITSYEEQKERLEVTGNRGKKLHDALDQLMQASELDMTEYKTTYEKDAIVTFIRMMRFLAPSKYETELIVADPKLRIAGTLDFHGWVDDWKLKALMNPIKYLEIDADGDFQLLQRWLELPDYSERKHIIIDWKFTGRNAYSHKVQVTAYKTMYNLSRPGRVSRAFTWRYSPRHKFGYDFKESYLNYRSFKRVYDTAIEFMGEFPEPPIIKRFPERVRLYQAKEAK